MADAERDEQEDEEAGGAMASARPPEVDWYLGRIEQALPRETPEANAGHPKVKATVARALSLWNVGEKVLVFCHYRATGRALERHISDAVDRAIVHAASTRFGLSEQEADARMERIGARLMRMDDPLRQEADQQLDQLVQGSAGFKSEEQLRIVEVMRRFFRTPAFLARFFPAHDNAGAIAEALEQQDASGMTLDHRFRRFCEFLLQRSETERAEYLQALDDLQTGDRRTRARTEDDESSPARLVANVRLVNGATNDDTRRRLLLAFNTPFFPEILVASSVLAEGVDLHLDCRFIIHHDLCWNPSTLEQRTGRVDRLGAKAEQAVAPIHVYLPYVAETQDEKMFRVVQDRERWFQVVMGESFAIDERSTDRQAQRVPLPVTLANRLALKLGIGSDT